MRTILTMGALAAALASATPVHADSFAYTGSPKQGEFYVRRSTAPQKPAWMKAHAEAPQPVARPVRGGIGLRMP
ncbi:hypothetical protein ACVOMS_33720 [Bradyrhizobium guangxiense]